MLLIINVCNSCAYTLHTYMYMHTHVCTRIHYCFIIILHLPQQLCSEDVLRAIKERDGMEMLTALVESGANINLPTADGSYPVHVAVASGHHDTVLFLLNKEANVKERRSVRKPFRQ